MGAVELSSSDMFGAGMNASARKVLHNDPTKTMRFVFENHSTTPPTPYLFPGMGKKHFLALESDVVKGTDESSRNETYRNEVMSGRFHISIYNSKMKKTTNLAPVRYVNDCVSHCASLSGSVRELELGKMQVDYYKSPSIHYDPLTWSPKIGNKKHLTYTVSYR